MAWSSVFCVRGTVSALHSMSMRGCICLYTTASARKDLPFVIVNGTSTAMSEAG